MTRASLLPLPLLLAIALLWGCSGEEAQPGNNNPAADMAPGTEDMGPGEDMAPGTEDMGQACQWQQECGAGNLCAMGRCVAAPECSSSSKYRFCMAQVDAIEPGLGQRAACDEGHCQIQCQSDAHCPGGQLCTDTGDCVPFTGEITGMHPGGEAKAPLQAGVGEAPLEVPVGLPLGGFGHRMDSGPDRYEDVLRPSVGMIHGLRARAILLDNGERQMIFIRLPIVFPTDAIHERVARLLQEETGRDWRDSLIISGTHTHSGPGRFLHLPRDAGFDLGVVGTDSTHDQALGWLVQSTFRAAQAALADRSPARLGWTIAESFDVDDLVSSDRWGETPPFDDNRALLMRIDDAEGNPRAAMISFGTHGTFQGDDYYYGDAPRAIEEGLERAFWSEQMRRVPVLFFNQNGGSMSPRGDNHGHGSLHRHEVIGRAAARALYQPLAELTTDDDVALSGRTHRFPITYESVGYAPGEWSSPFAGNTDLIYGGLQCASFGDSDYSTHGEVGTHTCIPVHHIGYNRPMMAFAKTQITAVQIDDLTLVTLPGEATMEMGWQVQRELQARLGVDVFKSFVLGYAQDHLLYLVPTNLRGPLPPFPGISTPMAPDDYPDYAMSWQQGGYEASSTLWGWRFGDFLVDRAVEAVGLLTGDIEQPEVASAMPAQFSLYGSQAFEIQPVAAEVATTVTAQPPAEVARGQIVEFAWRGGDVGAEMPMAPRVQLERQGPDDGWEPVTWLTGEPYGNWAGAMITRVRQATDSDAEGDTEWVVYWEELPSFPQGRYRFRAAGHTLPAQGAMLQPYEVVSDAFVVGPGALELTTIEATAQRVEVQIAYPGRAALSVGGDTADPGKLHGSYRVISDRVPSGQPAPLVIGDDLQVEGLRVKILDGQNAEVATIASSDLTLAEEVEAVDNRQLPRTRLSFPLPATLTAGTYQVVVEATDEHGNTGAVTAMVTVP